MGDGTDVIGQKRLGPALGTVKLGRVLRSRHSAASLCDQSLANTNTSQRRSNN